MNRDVLGVAAQLHAVIALGLAGLVGCGHAPAGRPASAAQIQVPAEISAEQYPELARVYFSLPLNDPTREALRSRFLDYLGKQTGPVLERGEYGEVVAHLAAMTDFLAPEELVGGRAPYQLTEIAKWIYRHGSQRGDEGRVLAALLILRNQDNSKEAVKRYRTVARWGKDARSTLPSTLERYSRLIEVWEEHERLTPAPNVQSFLARLYIERHRAILAMLPRDGLRMAEGGLRHEDLRAAPVLLRRAPLDVAGVFLRHGDASSALAYVESMGDGNGMELHLRRVLQDAKAGDDDAWLELARAYAEGRPLVARGICRTGLRNRSAEPRYPLCLARAASTEGDYPESTGWYAHAIRLAPENREIYDEALNAVSAFITEGIFDSDPSQAREMADAAEHILRERQRRWPDSEPAVAPQRLHFVVGLLEMNSGNALAAQKRFEASVAAEETAEALIELGRLAERRGQPEDAAKHYRRALDLAPGDGPQGAAGRAEILEHLGNAFRTAGDPRRAEEMYREALQLWTGVRRSLQQMMRRSQRAGIDLRTGVLLDRLNRNDDAIESFRHAIASAPDQREVYAKILSHLVVTEPKPALANEVFALAQRQLRLEPEWKVYFALWVASIATRAGVPVNEDVLRVLRSHSQDADWFGKLARFGAGELPYDALLAQAANIGERTEAHFYEGTRLLGTGDRAGAQRQFRRVLETDMVNFYEFIMARELLRP